VGGGREQRGPKKKRKPGGRGAGSSPLRSKGKGLGRLVKRGGPEGKKKKGEDHRVTGGKNGGIEFLGVRNPTARKPFDEGGGGARLNKCGLPGHFLGEKGSALGGKESVLGERKEEPGLT